MRRLSLPNDHAATPAALSGSLSVPACSRRQENLRRFPLKPVPATGLRRLGEGTNSTMRNAFRLFNLTTFAVSDALAAHYVFPS